MTDLYTQAQSAVASIRTKTPLQPTLGIILGSGLGNFATHVQNAVTIPYADIPHFPQSTVVGHSGRLVIGTIAGVPVAVMQGRVHAYEGYTMAQVTFPTRVLGLLGVQRLIVTNAAGGIDTRYGQGAIVAISDHINLTGTNAALGPNEPRFGLLPNSGQRFFDMSTAYSPILRKLAIVEATKQGWILDEGVYLAVLGPSYETPAEIRAFRTLGADLVGMSTVHEVIIARHMGIEVLGLSVVTNMAAGVLDQPINHEEVMEIGQRIEGQFTSLLTALVPQLSTPQRAQTHSTEPS
jgi:purine-nucleoside phosphorylase